MVTSQASPPPDPPHATAEKKLQRKPISRATRVSACGLLLLQGAILAICAVRLPYRSGWFSVLLLAGALVAVSTAVTGVLGWRHWGRLWRWQSILALALLLYFTYVVVFAAAHVAGLYDGLGPGVAAALLAVWGLPVLILLPTSLWGLSVTGGFRLRGSLLAWLVVIAAPGFGGAFAHGRAPGHLMEKVQSVDWGSALQATAVMVPTLPHATTPLSPTFISTATVCPSDPVALPNDHATLLATFVGRSNQSAQSICLQGAVAELGQRLHQTLAAQAMRAAVKIDVITGFAHLTRTPTMAWPFAVRPGLDGACAGQRCLASWQLVALEQFGSYRPLDFIEHLRLGVDLAKLAKHLGTANVDHLVRMSTVSLIIHADGTIETLRRLRGALPELTPDNVARASRLAEQYIRNAQRPDGAFVYEINPFTATGDHAGFSLARQAATTMVLCDLGQQDHPETISTAERSLALIAGLERNISDRSGAVVYPAGHPMANAGNVALALGAFIKCRSIVPYYDALITRLGHFLLSMQSSSGRFNHFYDITRGQTVKGQFGLYTDGEIIYALAMLEDLVVTQSSSIFPDRQSIHDTLERAMDYFGHQYWDHPAAGLFALEENWHCIAARTAMAHHHHTGYEQFCIDYARFKTRFVFDSEDRIDPQFVGSYGLSNVTVPMTTPTSGFGETAAGALSVLRKREQESQWLQAPLQRALRFLLLAQWTPENCFACTVNFNMTGGFSKSLSDPVVRIDYVQHAWAALGYGAQALGIEVPR